MTTPRPVTWKTKLEKSAPLLAKEVSAIQDKTVAEGALSAKTKTLMMMLCDALQGHDDGVYGISNRARALGATESEIAETVSVAFLMGGMPALVTGANAFRDKM